MVFTQWLGLCERPVVLHLGASEGQTEIAVRGHPAQGFLSGESRGQATLEFLSRKCLQGLKCAELQVSFEHNRS